MIEQERRNRHGYPCVRGGRNSPINAAIRWVVDRSNNKALPWISAMLAGFAAGGVLVICLLKPWEAATQTAKAELRTEFADVRLEARSASTDAAIWKNRVMKLEAQSDARQR